MSGAITGSLMAASIALQGYGIYEQNRQSNRGMDMQQRNHDQAMENTRNQAATNNQNINRANQKKADISSLLENALNDGGSSVARSGASEGVANENLNKKTLIGL